MTTPAQNQNDLYQPRRRVNFTTSWGSSGSWLVQNLREHYLGQRPISSTSPLRDDGTRAPLPWHHRWGRVVSPVRTGTVQVVSGTYNGYRLQMTAAVMGDEASGQLESCARMASAVGAHWVNGDPYRFPDSVRNAAVTKLRNKLRQEQASWGVTLGEMRSTIHGVRSIADQILGFADFLARRVRRSRREVWIFLTTNKWPARKGRPWSEATRIQREKWITNRWLEFKFSVVPTLMDIEQSGQALSWLLFDEGRPARFTEKAGASESWTGTWVSPWPTNGAFPGNLGASHTSLEAEARVHFSLVYDLVPTNLTTFQQLGLTNLAGVVWELTTFSWMVDYVLGVGDWVNSMVSLDGLRFVEGSESRIMTVKTAPVPIQIQPHPQNRVSGFSGVIPEAEAGRFQRVVLSELPAPALLPSARNKLGLSQLANVLAVIANVASAR